VVACPQPPANTASRTPRFAPLLRGASWSTST